jgi:RecA-family ATPase
MDAPSPEDFFSRYGTTESFFPPPLTDEDMDRLYGDDPGADHKLAQDEPVSSQVAPKLRIIDPSTLHGLDVPARRWIVPEWFPCGHATLNYGDGGVGKTLLAQQLMTSCATARPWCGLEVEQCRVFGFFCEDDADELHRRQVSICEAYGLSLADLGDMRWISGVGEDNLLVTFDQQGRLQLTARYAEILKGAKDFGAKMVVIDTAADTFGGNENDRSQVRQFIGTALNRLAQEIGGAVLLNAHPSRSGMSATGDMDGGSTGWSNSARSRWSLSRPKGEDGEPADTDERLLTRRKANYASIGDTIKLRWQNGVLVPAYAPVGLSAMAERSRAEEVFLVLLARCAEQGIYVHHTNTSTLYAPKTFSKRPDRNGLTLKEFDAAMNRLFASKAIRVESYKDKNRNARDRIVVVKGGDEGGETP